MSVVNPPPLKVPEKLREGGRGFWDGLINTVRLLWTNDRLRGTPRLKTVTVESSSDLPTASAGIIQLADNTYYEISGTFVTANSLKYGTNSFVAGRHWAADILYYTGSGAALIADNQAFHLKFITVVAPSGSAMSVSGGITTEFLTSLCAFYGCSSLGMVSGYRVPTFKSVAFDVFGTGLTMTGTSKKVLFDGCPFREMTTTNPALIFDASFSTDVLDLAGNYFNNFPAGGKGVEVIAGATFNELAVVRGNAWVGVDTPLVGFGPATLGWDFRANSGVSDSRVLGYLYKSGTTAATVLTVNTWTKAAMTTTLSSASERMDMPTSNRMRYTGEKEIRADIRMSVSITSASSNQAIEVSIYKNGTIVTGSMIEVTLTGPTTRDRISISTIENMVTNDYLELYIQNTTGSNNVSVNSFQFTISG